MPTKAELSAALDFAAVHFEDATDACPWQLEDFELPQGQCVVCALPPEDVWQCWRAFFMEMSKAGGGKP